jgi:hypothetical protein
MLLRYSSLVLYGSFVSFVRQLLLWFEFDKIDENITNHARYVTIGIRHYFSFFVAVA